MSKVSFILSLSKDVPANRGLLGNAYLGPPEKLRTCHEFIEGTNRTLHTTFYRAPFMFRVMIVDDQPAMRHMVQRILEPEQDFKVVGEATDGAEAVEVVDTLSLDGIIMDVQMPRMDGFEAAKLILARHPQLAIVLTSMNNDREYLRLASEIGVMGFIPKISLNAIILRQVLINGNTT